MTLTPKQKAAFDLLKEGPEYQGYFFNHSSDTALFFQLKEEGFFASKNNLPPIESTERKGLFTIPFWSALIYLEMISKEATKPENKKYAEVLLDIIREVTMPENDPNKRADNYRTWHIFTKIMANLPTDIIKIEDVDLIAYWLDSKFDNGMVGHEIGRNLLPKLLTSDSSDDVKKAVRVVEIITRPKNESPTLMKVDELEELFEKNAVNFGQKCGQEIVSILQSRLESEQVISENDDNYSYIWRSAVEDHDQNTSRHEPRHALISGLRDVLMAYAQTQDALVLFEKLWESPRLTVRRIVFFVLNRFFERYQSFCEKLIINNMPDVFLESNYHHEFYGLFVSHFSSFSTEVQDAVIKTLDDLQRKWPDDMPQEEQSELNMYMRRRWFHAIKQSGYSLSNDLDKKYDLKKYQPEHPEFLSYHGPVTWGTEQLFSLGDLMAKGSVKNIVDFLNDFKGKNRFNEVGYEEAGQVLKQAIKANQLFFEKDLNELLNGRYVYQYYALQAFEEIWNGKSSIDWRKVLDFSSDIVDSERLWEKESEQRVIGFYFRRDWIPSLIARFIQSGIRDDEWIMPDVYLPKVRTILEKLLEKVEPSAKGAESDGLSDAINSSKGHVIEAYINYALRECHILTNKYENKGLKERKEFWEEIKAVFNKELEKAKNSNFEFSALAGRYLPNLYYLSKEWVEEKINKIFPVEPDYEKNWRCAVSGYSYVNTVYTAIYLLLKDNGHLKRVLDTSFNNLNIRERIIENIAISYLRGDEELQGENSLMAYIMQKWESKDISSVIDLFWSHREVDFQNQEEQRILVFWEHCYNKIKGNEDANQAILSDLNLLVVFLKQIDSKSKEWLLQCAPYVDQRHHSYFFLEYMDKLVNISPKAVGEIYVAMLEKALPLYEEAHIRSIVEKIFNANEKVLANQICDRYTREGREFLKDLYDKYNQQ